MARTDTLEHSGRMLRLILPAVAVGAALFHLYAAGVSPFTALVQRPAHLAFMAVLGFMGVGIRAAKGRATNKALSVALAAAALFSCLYIITQHAALVRRSGSPTTLDLIGGVIAILVILELARRTTGWGLVAVCVLALAYASLGPYLPGFLAHRGYGLTRLVEHLYLSTEGIWGVPLGVSARPRPRR